MQLSTTVEDPGRLAHEEKLALLRDLADLVWDIEEELARVRAARADLMTSVQQDLRRIAVT